ncbi:MAG: hypothetical protein AAF557_12880 [Pseudomonadota bacterium]
MWRSTSIIGIPSINGGRFVTTCIAVLLLLQFSGPIKAQESAPSPEAPQTNDPSRADPFSPETIFERPAESQAPAQRKKFVPSAARPARLPELRLRGIGRTSAGAPPTVLLEIEGYGVYIVKAGDTISLQDLPAENVIRIKEVNDISVIIETGSFGELIVIR